MNKLNDDSWVWWLHEHDNKEEDDEEQDNKDECYSSKNIPLKSMNISTELQSKLLSFYRIHDFSELYKSYNWLIDTWKNGFPKIFEIENQMHPLAHNNQVRQEHVMAIVDWGHLPSKANVRCHTEVLKIPVFQSNGLPLPQLLGTPNAPLKELCKQTNGLGPTYLSKVMRFLAPIEYGAIDTRLVRIFGKSANNEKESWLSLKVQIGQKGRYYIPVCQADWPDDYSKWINILRFFANIANNPETGQFCPHPPTFIDRKLRSKGKWGCADIEMALFSYASQQINYELEQALSTENRPNLKG